MTASPVDSIKRLLLVPRKQDMLKKFEDLVREGYRIQTRGDGRTSNMYNLVSMFKENNSDSDPTNTPHRNKHLKSLEETVQVAPTDHGKFLRHLAGVRKTAAVNRVNEVDTSYLRLLHKYVVNSECLKGAELMFVFTSYTSLYPPNIELLRRTLDEFYEAGIGQIYERLKTKHEQEYQDYRLTSATRDQNVSSMSLTSSLDFSLKDPSGRLTVYLILIGFGLGAYMGI